jgi:hypothetical protein
MSECDRFEHVIQEHISGDANAADWDALIAHCKDCVNCRQLLALHAELTDLGAEFVELEDADLDLVRARVLSRVTQRSGQARQPRWWSWLPATPLLRPMAAGALAVLVFVVGVVIGSSALRSDRTDITPLLTEINDEALANRRLSDVENSPYTYSNVSFRRIDDERVALAFDVTTHVEAVESVQSELVKEVLVHSLLSPSHTGSRLKAISYAAEVMDPKVRDALIFAMRRDDNLAVRQKALAILAQHPADGTVETAVLDTLREDRSVQMRLLALDYLASRRVDHDLLRRAVQEAESETDATLLVRLADYER